VKLGLQAIVCVPMLARGALTGVLYLDARRPSFEWTEERLEHLEALSAQAAVALQNARQFEEQRRRSELIAAAAHELRAPLEAIDGYVARLREQLEGSHLVAEQHARTLDEQTRRVATLLSRLLDVSRVDPAELNWSMVSIQVKDLIESAQAQIGALASVHEVLLDITVPRGLPTILGNRQRLIQAVGTLLAEGIRASRGGGTLRLSASIEETPAGMTAHESDPLLFEHQADYELSANEVLQVVISHRHNPTDSGSGDEIGLSIAYDIIAHHGGRTWSDTDSDGARRTSLVVPVLVQKGVASKRA